MCFFIVGYGWYGYSVVVGAGAGVGFCTVGLDVNGLKFVKFF